MTSVTLAACSSGSSSGSASGGGGDYQVGFNSDLSGKYSLNGVGQRDGYKAYFDYVNSKGGINGHKVNVNVTDDASDVTRGTTNTTQLMTAKKVSAVGGYILSNVCGAAATIAATNKVPINCGSLAEDLLNPAKPFVYSAAISQNMEAGPIFNMGKTLVADKPAPKAAIIIFASAASVSLQQGLERYVKSAGWNLVANQSVPLTATDVSAQAATIIAAKPDVIMGSLYDPLAVSMMRALKAANLSVPFVDYDGATYKSGLLALKDPNFYLLSAKTADGVGDTQYLKDYQAAAAMAGKDPTTPFFNTGYVQALEIGEGLKKCGYPCDGAKLQTTLDTLDVDTQGVTSGNVTYTASNHEAVHSASFYVWDASKNAAVVAAKDLPEGDGK
ncbi:ABC transporter substrate-binding protein [Jatrophihabitans sp. GAS493]|uniref:ABC transporter substrate-binding protein n=1 Tax=Jatrophihabitans sp. GAS493 TaxID=1907575 RepID=UPI0012FE0035|nr:ABC transporter substrate-binding protein [Jatrophihabitans sp. GAS493]